MLQNRLMKIWSGADEGAQPFMDADSDLIRCEVASLWKLCLRPLNVQDANGSEHTSPRRARPAPQFTRGRKGMSSESPLRARPEDVSP